MKRVKIVFAALAVIFLAGAALAQMTVTRSEFARGVTAREPERTAKSFPADVGKVIFFNQLTGVAAPTTIKHVWIYDNKVQLEVKLAVEADGWRVWSAKNISAQQPGNWSVEVLDASGNVLESATFTVGR